MNNDELLESVLLFLDIDTNVELSDIAKELVHSLEEKNIEIDKNKMVGIVLFAHKLHRNKISNVDFNDLKDVLEINTKSFFFQAKEEMEKVRKDLSIPDYAFFNR